MPRINQLPVASSVAQTDVLAIDTTDKTYKVPRSVLAPAPYIATIPTGQWSGSGSDRYITVTASNVTANAMLYPFYDNASAAMLNGPVWAIPADGSFTIHTSAIPSGTVTISVLLAGIVGEAQYQVLADVYSKSQVDTIVQQSTAYIGTHVTSNQQTVSVASGAFVTVASVNLPAGVYIVTGRISFGTDATGRNIAFLTTISGDTSNGVVNSTAGNGRATLEITWRIGLESNGTVYLKAFKAAGTGNVDAYIDAIRLA